MGIVQSSLNKNTHRQKKARSQRLLFLLKNVFVLGCGAILASMNAGASEARLPNQNRNHVLVLEMTPAMCLFYPSRTQMRQCQEGYRVTVETLDLGYDCVSSTTPVLSPVQEKVVHRIMPDDTFIRQAWRRYGACSPYSASEYFRLVTRYSSKLRLPTELTETGQYRVDKNAFTQKFKRLNPDIGINQIYFSCQQAQQKSILTKIEICYANNNHNNCPKMADACQDQITIWGNSG
ncbi:ribonuclease T2 family protein [Psychrobacter sp. I-STPA10]|uniref:ribonuclease T2 family protein n=1 Tax=Psychrobacter sp. I-STPA10 TaxID=2585769 RepID=UPI001E4C8A75|nr:hypothetical protein [Psychrobacter sp. I-STPA10]